MVSDIDIKSVVPQITPMDADWEVKRLKYCAIINPSKSECHFVPDKVVSFIPIEKVSESGSIDKVV